MKKLITLLLATFLCFSAGLFVACIGGNGHVEHTFSSEWSKDSGYHYHECTYNGCSEKADRQAHTWDTGVEIDDQMVYTCTICEYTRKENIQHSYEVDASQWETALSLDVNYYDNYVINVLNSAGENSNTQIVNYKDGKVKITSQSGENEETNYLYREIINSENKFYSVYILDGDWAKREVYTSSFNSARTLNADEMFNYSDFTFDGTKYTAESVQTPGAPMTYDNVKIYFEDLKVTKIEFSFVGGGDEVSVVLTYTYGNASDVTIPEVKPDTKVTASEWHGAFLDLQGYFTYELEITENDVTESYTANVNGGQKIEIDFGEEYNVYYQKEVYEYYKYTNVDGRWKKTKVEQQEFNRFENYVVFMFGNMLVFEQFEYDDEDCVYKYIGEIGEEFEGSGVTVTFLDNRIKNINVKTVHGADVVEINCDYNLSASTSVVVPKLDTTVTASEWEIAFELDCDYEMKEIDEYSGQTHTSTLTKHDGNFCYEDDNGEIYYEKKNNRYFTYLFNEDKEGYLRSEIFSESFESYTNYLNAFFSSMYNAFTYNAELEAYVLEVEGDIFKVYMLDDRLIKVECELVSDEETSVITFDYENFTSFNLPEYIDLYAVTETEWAGAFNVDAQTNYTVTLKYFEGTEESITVYTKDGNVLRMVYGDVIEYFAKADSDEYRYYYDKVESEWKKEESNSYYSWAIETSWINNMSTSVPFSAMEYDVDDCEYSAETVASAPAFKDITFKFYEGKIIEMSISASEEDARIEVTIQYQGEQIELPEVYDATAVTSEQFYKAIDLPALVLGSNPQNFVYKFYEYGILNKTETLLSTTTVIFNGTTFYKEYIDEQNPNRNSYYIWHKVPEEEIEDSYSDPRYLYFYNESGTWNRYVYCSAKSNWSQGTKEYKEFIKFLFTDLLVVPGQQFNQYDVWENDYDLYREAEFEDFTYDSVNGYYYADQVGEYKFNVKLYFENQMLMGFVSESAPSRYDGSIAKYVSELVYSSYPIELPTEFTNKN